MATCMHSACVELVFPPYSKGSVRHRLLSNVPKILVKKTEVVETRKSHKKNNKQEQRTRTVQAKKNNKPERQTPGRATSMAKPALSARSVQQGLAHMKSKVDHGPLHPSLYNAVHAAHGRRNDPPTNPLVDSRKMVAVQTTIPFRVEMELNNGESCLMAANPHAGSFFDIMKFQINAFVNPSTSNPRNMPLSSLTWHIGENLVLCNNPAAGINEAYVLAGLATAPDQVVRAVQVDFPAGDPRKAMGTGADGTLYAYQCTGGEWRVSVSCATNASASVYRLGAADYTEAGVKNPQDLAVNKLDTLANSAGTVISGNLNAGWMPAAGKAMSNSLNLASGNGTRTELATSRGCDDFSGAEIAPITAPKFHTTVWDLSQGTFSGKPGWHRAQKSDTVTSAETRTFGCRVEPDRSPGAICWTDNPLCELAQGTPIGASWGAAREAGYYFGPTTTQGGQWYGSTTLGARFHDVAHDLNSPPLVAAGYVPSYNPFAAMSIGQDALFIRDNTTLTATGTIPTRVVVEGWARLVVLCPPGSILGATELAYHEAHIPWLPSSLKSVDHKHFEYMTSDTLLPDASVERPPQPLETMQKTRTLGNRLSGVFDMIKGAAGETWSSLKDIVVLPTIQHAGKLLKDKGLPMLMDAAKGALTASLLL